jgi:hypothetical protein
MKAKLDTFGIMGRKIEKCGISMAKKKKVWHKWGKGVLHKGLG